MTFLEEKRVIKTYRGYEINYEKTHRSIYTNGFWGSWGKPVFSGWVDQFEIGTSFSVFMTERIDCTADKDVMASRISLAVAKIERRIDEKLDILNWAEQEKANDDAMFKSAVNKPNNPRSPVVSRRTANMPQTAIPSPQFYGHAIAAELDSHEPKRKRFELIDVIDE
jgi:hypothetical protein